MKKILPLLFIATLFLLACNQVERVYTLNQLEPALSKHVGNPSRIDTTLKNEDYFIRNSSIHYEYDSIPEVSFTDIVAFLTLAYDCEAVLTISTGRKKAEIVPLQDGSGAYMLQVLEWYGSKDNKRHLGFSVLDVNNELVTPSSPTPQTTALSK